MAVSLRAEVLLSLSFLEYVKELSKHLATSIYEKDHLSPKCLQKKTLMSLEHVMKASALYCEAVSERVFLLIGSLETHYIPLTFSKWPKEWPMIA